MGFDTLAVFEKVGYKKGAWHAVTWFARTLHDFEDCPQAPTGFRDLNPSEVQKILNP